MADPTSKPGLLQITPTPTLTPARPEPESAPLDACVECLDYILAHDGAGSGLDADTLDGLDPQYFTDIVARLGYTPVNKAGDTMLGPLILANDPTLDEEAATKEYVDAAVAAINVGNVSYSLRLYFEGTELGVVYALNFTGEGIEATYDSPTGTVTVTG